MSNQEKTIQEEAVIAANVKNGPDFIIAYRNVLSLFMIQDPMYTVDMMAGIYDNPSAPGVEPYKEVLLDEWSKFKKLMSAMTPKDPENPNYKKICFQTPNIYQGTNIGTNEIEICQSTEGLITVTGIESFKYPGGERERHQTTVEFQSFPRDPKRLKFVTVQDQDIANKDDVPQRFIIGKFPNQGNPR